jgi:preprotein translocase subunit SecF
MTATMPAPARKRGFRGTLADIYHERTHFDFIGKSRRWLIVSIVLVTISLGALVVNGLNLGIEFTGGSQWQFTVSSGTADGGDVRDALSGTEATTSKILILGDDGVRVQSEDVGRGDRQAITEALATYAGIETTEVSFDDVGATWGEQVSRKALTALVAFFALIALYLTLRLEWKMALSAIIAVIHDIIVTVGVYAVTGFEVTPATVVAFLTILGFSLYDTVVVFDKVRENTPSVGNERGDTYSAMVNRSMNQVLMRSLNTSFVALLPVASLLVVGSTLLGGLTLRDFALALFVGIAVGAYSSIYVATPLLAWMKEREPRYRSIRERALTQRARDEAASGPPRSLEPGAPPASGPPSASPSASGASAPTSTATAPPTPAAPPPASGQGGVAPRPRQQRRRKRR